MRWLLCLIVFLSAHLAFAQTNIDQEPWHGIERQVHYLPSGSNFICVDPYRKFNRALYGTHTAFRVEAGDLPEFALYMPGMGGNCQIGFVVNGKSKWASQCGSIKTTYVPGSMVYELQDPLLGKGQINLTVLALADAEGMVVRISSKNMVDSVKLVVLYGGASGRKFSRDGDIGADPESSFYLQASYCKDNRFKVERNSFHLFYGSSPNLSEEQRYEIQARKPVEAEKGPAKELMGLFPASASLQISDAAQQSSPLGILASSPSSVTPVIAAWFPLNKNGEDFFTVYKPAAELRMQPLAQVFASAEQARKNIAGRIQLKTPDAFINPLAGALGIAADGIWEAPTYMHGAVAWRMRLPAWRGPYCADPLGWHDRAREHFSSYAKSQVTTAPTLGVVADTALHLARQLEKIGTQLFSDGYICRNPNGDIRAHHYDMNLVFIDQLLNHFNWTGDTAYVRHMFPLLKRHLAWEKRNFDMDGDGLYDAYAAIWASDALQYSGGGVAHTSAYNYRANKMVAELATLIGEDGTPYKNEADHILQAMNHQLWMPGNGWYAEYRDALGLQLLHPSAGLWTIYHAIDSKLPDAFQAYQCLQYIDEHIPHIPVRAAGLADKSMYLLSTTNWQPYTWSLNNVVLAENQHTSLAYWQGGRPENAYELWRSSLVESMYLSASPGGFEQLSFYDAVRGELYRDFADPIGMVSRTLVEGLFGVQPDALHRTLVVQPGFPMQWGYASLKVPDISIDYKKEANVDRYTIIPSFAQQLQLKLRLRARLDGIESITVNGKRVSWHQMETAIEWPMIEIDMPALDQYSIAIQWKGQPFEQPGILSFYRLGVMYKLATMQRVFDPQKTLSNIKPGRKLMSADILGDGRKTIFVQVKQGAFTYWQAICFANPTSVLEVAAIDITAKTVMEKVDLHAQFNAKVTDIFKQQYLRPRPVSPTLQLPTQGIGNWCYLLTEANINDSGLRAVAGHKNEVKTPTGIAFATPSNPLLNNILFTSRWDNYPKQQSIGLSGTASHAYLLMAGSTNAMQSRMVNGMVEIAYTDGSKDSLELRNPENWWPIEQDYYDDGYAFTTGAPKPLRMYLKEGRFAVGLNKYGSIKGFSNRAIDGGAATVLDMPLDPQKTLQSLTVRAIANDVVIGLMAVTLIR